jgi:hypothetical protein
VRKAAERRCEKWVEDLVWIRNAPIDSSNKRIVVNASFGIKQGEEERTK